MTRLGLTRRSPLARRSPSSPPSSRRLRGRPQLQPARDARSRPRTASSRARPQAQSIADTPWWEVAKDPQLQALIREAIANNLDLRVATARVAEARAQYGIARSFLFPEVGVSAGYSAQQGSRLSEPPQGTAAGEDATRTTAPASRSPGRSTSSAGSAGRRRRRSPPTSPPRRVGARRSSRSWRTSRPRTSSCGSWTSSSRSPGARCQTNEETVQFYEKRLQGGVSNRLEVDRAVANRARTAAVIPRARAGRSRSPRTPSACCSAGPRGRSSAAGR